MTPATCAAILLRTGPAMLRRLANPKGFEPCIGPEARPNRGTRRRSATAEQMRAGRDASPHLSGIADSAPRAFSMTAVTSETPHRR